MHRFLCLLLLGTALLRAENAAPSHPSEPPNLRPSGRMVTLSDFGAEDLAYLALPPTPPTMGLVLVPDAFGLDDAAKAEADRLAAQGYLALVVDIYNGHQNNDTGEMANMVANLNVESVMKTVGAGIRLFHESRKFKVDHVVVIGWGAGASYAFQVARDDRSVDGVINFYGPVETNLSSVTRFAAPLCAIYPTDSPVTPRPAIEAFQQRMKEVGSDFEAWFIAAAPGWAHPRSKGYSPAEDREAWKVALPFLIRIAATPVKDQSSFMDKAKTKIESLFK